MANRRQPPKPWQIKHPSLAALDALNQTGLLDVGTIPSNELAQAVGLWTEMPEEDKEFLQDAMQYARLQIADEQRRLLARIENHLGSIRTGSRLTVEALKGLGAGFDVYEEADGFGVEFPEDTPFPQGFETDQMGGDPEDAPTDDSEADALFAALDAADDGVVLSQASAEAAAQMDAIEPAPPAPKRKARTRGSAPKRKARTRGSKSHAKRAAADNGAPVVADVLDANGDPIQPSV